MTRGRLAWEKMAAAPEPMPAPGFPDTRTSILVRAAEGEWEPFLAEYLAPCWRDIMIACRGRIPAGDAPDLLQELTLRLMRDGQGRPVPGSPGEPPRGNIPRRYLARKTGGVASARFRTFLKQVIANLIKEHVRHNRRAARSQDLSAAPDPAVEDSVSSSVDRQWVAMCLADAARAFRAECAAARTRARRRRFELLYLATAKGLAPAAIGDRLGLHRTTVAAELAEARERFVGLLAGVSGIADRAELKRHVAADPARLFDALERAHRAG